MRAAAFFLALCFAAPGLYAYQCPAPAAPSDQVAEDALDCPWAGAARLMEKRAAAGEPLAPVLTQYAPGLAAQLASDKANSALKELWGESINYDELARGVIVHEAILSHLASALGLPGPRGRIVHAGMEHVYGYLFSLLQTKFGFKRARWVRDDIEAGLGFARGSLGPEPSGGTLLANLTCVTGRTALRDDPRALALLERAAHACLPAARDWRGPGHFRLSETVELSGGRSISLRTDFIPFSAVSSGGNSYLLIYSVKDSAGPHAVLVTAFPVAESFVARALDQQGLGPDKPVQTRYNAWVEGLPQKMKGLREASWVSE